MKITFYSTDYSKSLPIVPGTKEREWIDQTNKVSYNDVSTTMASQSGWEFRAPDDFTIEWNGGDKSEDTVVHSFTKDAHLFYTGMGYGICSIRAGYIVETPDDYSILSMQAPNFFKDGATQLTSLLESNWSHMTFFLNWKMTRPGKVEFKKNEPLGFVTIVPHRQFENFEFVVDSLITNQPLLERYSIWQDVPTAVDPYAAGIENSESKKKTKKFHTTNRKLKVVNKVLT
jgi:hypothetical protein